MPRGSATRQPCAARPRHRPAGAPFSSAWSRARSIARSTPRRRSSSAATRARRRGAPAGAAARGTTRPSGAWRSRWARASSPPASAAPAASTPTLRSRSTRARRRWRSRRRCRSWPSSRSPAMPEALIQIAGLTYRYPDARGAALSGVDFEVAEGAFLVVAGRSGSGKSTLLRACCGLVPHYHGGEISGRIEVAGLDVRDHGPAELGGVAGLVAQDPETQVVATTVRAELELPLELRGEPAASRARAIEEVALALAIPHLLDRPCDTLSGGELQRVALAAALVVRPRVVLLDEPTSQLDPVAGDELIWLLRRLNEEWGLTVVVAEHRLERCLHSASQVLALRDGTVAFRGPPGGFLEWALAADAALATPAARLFALAGIRPLPVGVKEARAALGPLAPQPGQRPAPAGRSAARRRGRRATALRARGLWVSRDAGDGPREVLRGLELEIAAGERVALMGRNGAGKTTLLRAIAGLEPPLRGRIEAPRGSALVPQSPGDLFLRERAGEELPGPAGREALARAGLGWAEAADPRDLSGGERERLALAIVIAGRDGVGGEP